RGHGARATPNGCQRLERKRLRPEMRIHLSRKQVPSPSWRRSRAGAFADVRAEEHETLRRTNRQTVQEKAVEEREDGRISADADREREDRDRREPGVLHEQPQGVPEVAARVAERAERIGVARLLAHERGAAEAP